MAAADATADVPQVPDTSVADEAGPDIAELPDIAAPVDANPDVGSGPEISATADADAAAADIAPPVPGCFEPPAPATVAGEPMTYAKAAPSTVGKVTCGAAAAPYFWANADMPAPIPCTDACAPAAHADTTVCAGGQCLVARCAPGWQDRNGWGNDGCEAEMPVACDLHVEATALGQAGQDGSAAHPFAGIRSALCVAKAGCVVHVGPGTYAGDVALTKPGLVLRGAGPEKTVLIGDKESTTKPQAGGAPTILITADDVVVEGLAIVNGYRSGISASASVGRPLLRQVAVKNVEVFSPNLYNGTEQVSGIRIDATGARVIASTVSETGGLDGLAWVKPVTGVSVGANARVLGVRVDGVQAMQSCYGLNYYNPLPSDCPGMAASLPGADAIGIAGGSGSIASGCDVRNLKPSKGNGVPTSGKGNAYEKLADGNAVAFAGIGTDSTDSLDSQPWIDLVNCDGGTVHDVSLIGAWQQIHVSGGHDVFVHDDSVAGTAGGRVPAIAMNGCENCQIKSNKLTDVGLTGIAVDASPNVIVQGNQVQSVGVNGGYKDSIMINQPGTATGILVQASAACIVAGNSISGVVADMCGSCYDDTSDYNPHGGDSVGIEIVDGNGCNVTANIVSGIKGGPRPPLQSNTLAWALGIVVTGTGPVAVEHNRIVDVTGANGSSAFLPGAYPENPAGQAAGIVCGTGACTAIAGNAILGVVPGKDTEFNNWGYASTTVSYCVELATTVTATVTIDHLTCIGAIYAVQDLGTGAVELRNSIIANVTTAFGTYGKFAVAWTDLWNAGAVPGKVNQGPGILNVDPLFVDAKTDVHLQSTSPAIDAGDPAAPYCGEPAPNGCRVDLGAYGGTAQATPKVGAKQCECP